MPITKSILLILTLFFLNSCSVHTFTYGDGPKQGFTKVLKQQNLTLVNPCFGPSPYVKV